MLPLTARIVKAETAVRPKWDVHVTYAVPISKVKKGAADGAVGLDRNVGQATDSEGAVYPMTPTLPGWTPRSDAHNACRPAR